MTANQFEVSFSSCTCWKNHHTSSFLLDSTLGDGLSGVCLGDASNKDYMFIWCRLNSQVCPIEINKQVLKLLNFWKMGVRPNEKANIFELNLRQRYHKEDLWYFGVEVCHVSVG